jgi:UDP-glucuronate 4-epimerase
MPLAIVTGGAGFIGSQLCGELLDRGFAVRAIDSFTAHYARELKELNAADLRRDDRFELVEADIATAGMPELLEGADVVYHLAARPGVRDSWSDFSEYVHANIEGSRNVFAAAADIGVRVVYASSSSIYGDAADLPVTEATPLRPISPYGATKVMTEVLASAYGASFGLDAVGMRYFTVYGPRQRPDMALSKFIEAAVAGETISIYGDGRQLRDMTYVGDVVAGTLLAAERGRAGGVYNIASNASRSLLDILGVLEDVMDLRLDLEFEEQKAGDVRDTWGGIDRAGADLGFAPATDLEAGLTAQVAEAARRREALSARRA